jgi:hypothetical protein
MTGPKAARSTGDGALLGDATALATGGLVAGATLDGTVLGSSLTDAADEAGDDGALEIAALAALGAA